MASKKFLQEDRKHADRTHERWLKKYPVNRDMMSPSYKEEWYFEQCLRCQFYVTLTGQFELDWGVCSNEASYLDGRVMFEHDGCEFFSFAEDEFNS